jgi:soluble lytic murein transglycosylase-like protein
MTPLYVFAGVGVAGAALYYGMRDLVAAPAAATLDATPLDVAPEPSGPLPEAIDTVPPIDYSVGMNTVPESKPLPAWGTKYDALIRQSADANGLDPDVLYRLLFEESRFRPDIISGATVSPVGAIGIAQFMPATAREELGSIAAARDPKQAIPGAAKYLAKLIRAAGSVDAGVASYNWGIGNVTRKGLAAAPQETIAYVKNITGNSIA